MNASDRNSKTEKDFTDQDGFRRGLLPSKKDHPSPVIEALESECEVWMLEDCDFSETERKDCTDTPSLYLIFENGKLTKYISFKIYMSTEEMQIVFDKHREELPNWDKFAVWEEVPQPEIPDRKNSSYDWQGIWKTTISKDGIEIEARYFVDTSPSDQPGSALVGKIKVRTLVSMDPDKPTGEWRLERIEKRIPGPELKQLGFQDEIKNHRREGNAKRLTAAKEQG